MSHDYKGRPRMLSSEHGMVAADQGDCSALGRSYVLQHTLCLCHWIIESAALCWYAASRSSLHEQQFTIWLLLFAAQYATHTSPCCTPSTLCCLLSQQHHAHIPKHMHVNSMYSRLCLCATCEAKLRDCKTEATSEALRAIASESTHAEHT